MITHLEPDIPVCRVTLTLQSITTSKASDGDIMAVELFQILQDDAVEALHTICSIFGKVSRGRSGKGQFSFQSQRKAMPKKAQTTAQLYSSHKLAK